MTQNARGLPRQVRDNGVLDDVYSYDANGNVTGITDGLQGIGTCGMSYDELDRLTLTTAGGLWARRPTPTTRSTTCAQAPSRLTANGIYSP